MCFKFFSSFIRPTTNESTSSQQYLQKMRWKNERPKDNSAYVPTKIEHVANVLSHGFFVLPVIYLSYDLFLQSKSSAHRWASVVYGAVLIGLFTVSTVFHLAACAGMTGKIRECLHRGDRAMIYLFIAGAYTPWLTLKAFTYGGYTEDLRWVIWIIASAGIIYQQLFHEKYKWLETVFYVSIALVPSVAAVPEMTETDGLWELQLGGIAYLTGVIFFKMDGIIPFAHAIWHIHVVIGTVIHYYAVKYYLYTTSPHDESI